MGNSMMNSALTGLNASQRGLATVGHNIANVDTPGYSRQRTEQVALTPQFTGSGYLGQGVRVSAIARVYDTFVNEQLTLSHSSGARLDSLHELSASLDRMLGDSSNSLSTAMQDFFGAVQDATVDPTSMAARGVLVSEGEALVQRMSGLDQRLTSDARNLEQRMQTVAGEVNTIARSVSGLNQRILEAEGRSAGNPANDLRDQRDELMRQLAQRVDVTSVEQGDGTLNVSVAGGQLLVAGSTAGALSLSNGLYDPARLEVSLTVAGSSVVIGEQISGGELGGILQFRDQVLEPARNAIGRIAIGISEDVNLQHRLGQDLNGNPGGNFFRPLTDVAVSVFSHASNTSGTPATITAGITDSTSLTTSDYVLTLNGANYDLLRLSDGVSTTLAGLPTTPVEVDGIRLEITAGAMAAGDSFLIAPTRFATKEVGMVVSDARSIALAAPVRIATAPGNIGNASISQATVNSANNTLAVTFNSPASTFDVVDQTTGATLAAAVGYVSGTPITFNGVSFDISDGGTPPAAGDVFTVVRGVSQPDSANTGGGAISVTSVSVPDSALTDSVSITFDDPPTTFTVAGATTGSPTAAITYVPGQPISFNGWTVNLVGSPAAGDSFSVVRNVGGVGDNRNGLALASLQTSATLDGATASYDEAYGQLISRVGSQTRQAEVSRDAQNAVVSELEAARASTSGVNLDEEAADLLRFQQSYAASAQMIRAADQLFQTLLGVVAG